MLRIAASQYKLSPLEDVAMKEQWAQKIRQCQTLPSLPTIAVQILDLAQRPDADLGEIARLISKDPALSGKILRTVNSSFYGRSQNISTVSQALVILGLQSVKTLVLGFSLVSNLSKSRSRGFQHIHYWKRSIYAATAAKVLAAKLKIVQTEEAFLAALLCDIGQLVFDQIVGSKYGELFDAVQTHGELPAAEKEKFGITHAEVGGLVAECWKLPPLLTVSIEKHETFAEVADPTLRRLAELSHLAGRCADIFVDDTPAPAIAEVRKTFVERHQIPAAECDLLLEEIGKKTKEAASLFEINIGSGQSFEAILKRANEALVEMTLQTQQQASTLQQQASTLAEQNVRLKQAAETDALTGLANRATFDQFLATQLDAAVRAGEPLSLLLLDVDKFKGVNDRYGHPAGDAVLRSLGRLLRTAVRSQDLAARYGGEEMCLVLPGTPRATAAQIAEAVRRAIAATSVQVSAGAKLSITASIGVACLEPGGVLRSVAHLLKAADLGVYAAKHGGRNCVKVFSMPGSPAKSAAAPATPVAA